MKDVKIGLHSNTLCFLYTYCLMLTGQNGVCWPQLMRKPSTGTTSASSSSSMEGEYEAQGREEAQQQADGSESEGPGGEAKPKVVHTCRPCVDIASCHGISLVVLFVLSSVLFGMCSLVHVSSTAIYLKVCDYLLISRFCYLEGT